jgi:hypothetical protein
MSIELEVKTKRKPVFGVKGIAEYYGISERSAEHHIRMGRIPVNHWGRMITAHPDQLDEAVSAVSNSKTEEVA